MSDLPVSSRLAGWVPSSERSLDRGFPGRIGSHHRAGLTVAALLVSGIAGLAVALYPPLIVIGALICVVAAIVIIAYPFVGLLFYTVAFMLRPGEVYPILQVLHIERILGILVLAALFLEQYRTSRRLSLDGTRQTRLFLFLLVPILISIPFAYYRSLALTRFVDFLKLATWYILVVHLVNTRLRLRIYAFLFFALIGYIAADTLIAYLNGFRHVRMGVERAVGQTSVGGDANGLAATMAATIPTLLLFTFNRRLRSFRLLFGLTTVLLTVTMALTGSRSGLLGFLGGLLFLWWYSRRRLITGFIAVAILFTGVWILPQQYKARYATLANANVDSSANGRTTAWKAGLRMVADHPFTGVGIGCFMTAHARDYSPPGHTRWLDSHSLYVQVLAELGLLGAAVFFAFLIEIFRLNRSTLRRMEGESSTWGLETALLKGMAAGTFALLITGLAGHSFMRYTWYVYAALGAVIWRLRKDSLPGLESPAGKSADSRPSLYSDGIGLTPAPRPGCG